MLDELKADLKHFKLEIYKVKICYGDFIFDNNKLIMQCSNLKEEKIPKIKVKTSLKTKYKTTQEKIIELKSYYKQL